MEPHSSSKPTNSFASLPEMSKTTIAIQGVVTSIGNKKSTAELDVIANKVTRLNLV